MWDVCVFLRGLFVFCAGADVFQNGRLQFPTLSFWAEPCFFDPVCMYTDNGCSKLYTQAYYYTASVEWACAKV